ncbi:MAG: protein kinase [Opitutales bacterium]|nr:protein kinase [Opitutales bacterium]
MSNHLHEGYVLGDYRIIRLLGAGAMGEVYEAEQKHLGRHYAVKVLPAEHGEDPSFRERFRSEARLLASLEHPNVVGIHNAGESEGRFFLVMELLEPFNEAQKGPLELPAVQRMIGQVLSALTYAHRQGVIHRDLKPANLLRTSDGQLKVADFGVAKVLGESFVQSIVQETIRRTRMSDAATVVEGASNSAPDYVGTLQYMAPEVLDGQPADARSDLYAVGVMAYEWLTGRKPVGRYKDASRLLQGLDPAWDAWLDAMMAAEVEERIENADEALRQLSALPLAAPASSAPIAAPTIAPTTQKASAVKSPKRIKPSKEERKQISKRVSHLYWRSPWAYIGIAFSLVGLVLFFSSGLMLALVPVYIGLTVGFISQLRFQSMAKAEWRASLPEDFKLESTPTVKREPTKGRSLLRFVGVVAVVGLLVFGVYYYWADTNSYLSDPPDSNSYFSSEAEEPQPQPEIEAEVMEEISESAEALFWEGATHRYWYENLETAADYFREAASQGHYLARAELALVIAYLESGKEEPDYTEAYHLAEANLAKIETQAALGSVHDQVVLSQLYGLFLIDIDDYAAYNLTVDWAVEAAGNGYYLGEFLLGNYYFTDTFLERDFDESFRWYLKAANKGHTYSQMSIGVFYEYGFGVEVDIDEAKRWYQRAADQGYTRAADHLAAMQD